MFQSSNIQISSDIGSNTNIVLGMERQLTISLSNVSPTQKAYNVSAELIVSDGLAVSSSVPAYTSFTQDTARRYTIRNFKDFAPLESGTTLTYVMDSLTNYMDQSPVAFGTAITVNLSITWDSMPRGNYDAGNAQYYNVYNFALTTSRLSVTKSLPAKRVKGAGDATASASKPFDCVVEIINNVRDPITFTIADTLANGFRYLGGYSIVTPSQYTLPAPTLAIDTSANTQTLNWGNFTLLAGERIKFKYSTAIYDRYMLSGLVNTGDTIPHGTVLPGTIGVTAVGYTQSANYAITAMDLVLSVTQDKSIVDCNDTISYALWLEANQYHDISSISAQALVPDGQTPASYPGGSMGAPDANYNIPISYSVGTVAKNTTQQFALSALVRTAYRADGQPVACGDGFTLSANAAGTNADTTQSVSDSASISQSIILPAITKVITGKYYRSMQAKTIPALAPLDYIQYELTYDSRGIEAAQLGIFLDDFFPLDSSVPAAGSITLISGPSVTPLPVDPHGLRWSLGNVATGTVWKVRVNSQIASVITTDYTVNLFKLTGQNHAGESYSGRTNTSYQTGIPNIVVTRSIIGINITKVESLQRYTASITFTNTQTADLTVTDAFHFDALAQIDGGIEIDAATISVTGTGAWSTPIITTEQMSIAISRLRVGEYITISYQAVIPQDIPPSYAALLASQLEVPYTQPFDILSTNVKYNMDAVISSFYLRSAPLVISKSYNAGVKQIGDSIDYTVAVTVPKGTAVFNAILADTLPTEQSYTGNAMVNGASVSVSYQNKTVTFPVQAYLYSSSADVTVTYGLSAVINDAATTSADVTQRNNCIFSGVDKDGAALSASGYKNVTVSNPHLSLSMWGTGSTLSVSSNTSLALGITNVGKVTAAGVTVAIPIPAKADYVSSSSTVGVPVYSALNNTLTLSLPSMAPAQSVTLSYVIVGDTAVQVGDSISMIGQSGTYTNTLSPSKLYPSVTSNSYLLSVSPGTLLTIYPPFRSQSGNGYVQVSGNSIAVIPYTLVNQGGGIDSFRLSVSTSKYPYVIQVAGNTIATVAAGSAYSG
ncbi:MAG: hypothetical protein RSF86_01810, partial [Angelakisella sp.]